MRFRPAPSAPMRPHQRQAKTRIFTLPLSADMSAHLPEGPPDHLAYGPVVLFGHLHCPVRADGDAAAAGLAADLDDAAHGAVSRSLEPAGLVGTDGDTVAASRAGSGIGDGVAELAARHAAHREGRQVAV